MKIVNAIATVLLMIVGLALSPQSIAQTQIKVTSATPASAFQGTLSLDVVITGSGFDATSKAQFVVAGTADTGGITVRKTVYRNSKEIVATIDVADTATIANFDVIVALDSGRKGKGTTLFAVQSKTNDPCAASGLDFPAFTFSASTVQGQQIYVADASGKCVRPVYTVSSGTPAAGAFSYPIAGTTDVGRVTWREGVGAIYGITFRVVGTSISVSPRQLLVDFAQTGVIDSDLSSDGSIVYASLDSGGAPGSSRIIAVTLADGSQRLAYEGPADGSAIRDISVDADGTLFFAHDGAASGRENRLLRVEPTCASMSCATVLATSPYGTQGNNFPAANRGDSRLAYSYYLPGYYGCWLLQVIPDMGGALLNSGQPRYGNRTTWLGSVLLTNGIKPPSGSGRCDTTGIITQIDPATSAETPLVKGKDPDAR